MRVAVVCDWFLKYAVQQATALKRHGLATALVCRDHAHEFGGLTAEREAALAGARAEGVAIFVLRGRASSALRGSRIVRLRRELLAWRPDIVHAHDNTDPGLLAACRGIPRVLTVHDPVPHPGAPKRSLLKRSVAKLWIRGASALVVHSPRLVDELAAAHPEARIVVIPHGTELAERPYERPAQPRLLFFGRREPYKGLPVLLRAMHGVWAVRPEAQLAIHGSGAGTTALPGDPRVTSTDGYVPEGELDRMFRESSLVVLPYVQASQSGVGALAVARGIPTLVTDAGGLADLAVADSLVVARDNARALATAIVANLDHGDDLRLKVWNRARDCFAWPVVAARSARVYEDILRSAVS